MCRGSCYFLISLVCFAIAKTDGKYRYDYSYNKEAEGWLKLHLAPVTFTEAFLRCKLEGAVLASPLNVNIQEAMVTMMAASNIDCGIFTGIHATISKGDFTSIEGVPMAKIPLTWAPDEPDNFENQEDCIMMLRNGTVADTKCKETYPYVCYKKKTSAPMISACGTTDPGYNLDMRTGNCYKFHYVGTTWKRAQMTCLAEGGYLAVINNPAEVQVLKDIYARYGDAAITAWYKSKVSIGFLDWDQKGSWYTVNGLSLEETYKIWLAGQPDNIKDPAGGGQHCGGIDRNGWLHDLWCEYSTFPYICEKTTDSLVMHDEE